MRIAIKTAQLVKCRSSHVLRANMKTLLKRYICPMEADLRTQPVRTLIVVHRSDLSHGNNRGKPEHIISSVPTRIGYNWSDWIEKYPKLSSTNSQQPCPPTPSLPPKYFSFLTYSHRPHHHPHPPPHQSFLTFHPFTSSPHHPPHENISHLGLDLPHNT